MAHNDRPEIVENFDLAVPVDETTEMYDLLDVVGRENRRISLDIEEIYDDRFLSTATGVELNKIGDLVGVSRKNNENDEKLRKRIRGEWAAQASSTTFDNFATIALSLLETDKTGVSIRTPPEVDAKTVEVSVDSATLDANPLARNELTSLLERSVSADATVRFVETGTFAFAGDDSTLEGWDEGTWSSSGE